MGSFEIVSVGARMSPIVHLHQVLCAHMRVALGRAEAAVTEELLDEAQVRAFAEHVGGEAVAKGVGSDAALDPCRARPDPDDAVDATRGEAAAARIGEERAPLRSPHAQPRLESLEVDVVQIEATALGDAEPGGVEQLEDRAVAQPRLRSFHGRIEQVLRLVLREEGRQPLRKLGAPDLSRDVELDRPPASEVLETASHAGQLASHGGTRELTLMERGEPGADGAGVSLGEAAQLLAREEGPELGEIGGVAAQGVTRDPALVIEITEELADGVLHEARLTRRKERPLPGSRTRRARTGVSACRPWPPAR